MWLTREIIDTFPGGRVQVNDNVRKIAFLADVIEARLVMSLTKSELEVKLVLNHIVPLSEELHGKRTNFTPVKNGWAKGAEVVQTMDLNKYHTGNIGPAATATESEEPDRFILESAEETIIFTPGIDLRKIQYQETHISPAS